MELVVLSLAGQAADDKCAFFTLVNMDRERVQVRRWHAVQVCPDSAKVRLNMGILERRYGRWADSLRHFERAREIEPGCGVALLPGMHSLWCNRLSSWREMKYAGSCQSHGGSAFAML